MGKNFSAIKAGTYFTADGMRFKKTSELTYDDSIGLEHYIGSELGFDEKINAPDAPPKPGVDTSARVVKSDETTAKPKKAKKSKKAK
jgi:hypothetical protein